MAGEPVTGVQCCQQKPDSRVSELSRESRHQVSLKVEEFPVSYTKCSLQMLHRPEFTLAQERTFLGKGWNMVIMFKGKRTLSNARSGKINSHKNHAEEKLI